jgi:hypothetical protein
VFTDEVGVITGPLELRTHCADDGTVEITIRYAESRWEDRNPHEVGRPRRRYYRLTPDGVVFAARALGRVRTPAPLLARLQPGPALGATP